MRRMLLLIPILLLCACAPGTPANNEARRSKLVEDGVRVYPEMPDATQAGEMIERGRRVFRTAGCDGKGSMKGKGWLTEPYPWR